MKTVLVLLKQEPLAFEDMVGVMERGGGRLYVGALSARTFLFWTWLLWRRVRVIFLGWQTLKNQEWEVQRGLQRFANSSTSQRMMMSESMSTHTADHSQPNLVGFLILCLSICLSTEVAYIKKVGCYFKRVFLMFYHNFQIHEKVLVFCHNFYEVMGLRWWLCYSRGVWLHHWSWLWDTVLILITSDYWLFQMAQLAFFILPLLVIKWLSKKRIGKMANCIFYSIIKALGCLFNLQAKSAVKLPRYRGWLLLWPCRGSEPGLQRRRRELLRPSLKQLSTRNSLLPDWRSRENAAARV